jgi:hypothetical protein
MQAQNRCLIPQGWMISPREGRGKRSDLRTGLWYIPMLRHPRNEEPEGSEKKAEQVENQRA